jgi:hypothetical protein
MTLEQKVNALVAGIRGLIEARIAADQGRIGIHEDAARAQAALADALKSALATRAEERAQ